MIVVVGMARSGLAVARLMRAWGFDVRASEAGSEPPLAAEFERSGIPYETGGHSPDLFLEAEEIVVSPGVPLDIEPLMEARRRGIPLVSELEVASRHLEGDIVAITGSNGKTTTTSLIGHILSKGRRPVQVGGNIGTPASALVASSTKETINVIEVSSFQLDLIRDFRPHVGVLLNITPDHLDRYPNFEAYRMSKLRLFENQLPDDYAVVNLDDREVYPLPRDVASRQIRFSRLKNLGSGAWIEDGNLVVEGMPLLRIDEVPLRGPHNLDNVLAALLVAEILHIAVADTVDAVRAFRPAEHRLETVGKANGIEFVNDSKATNVDAAVKALDSFTAPVVLIAGGQAKGGSFEPLVDAMKGKVRRAVLIGAAAARIGEAIGNAVPISLAGSMAEAVETAVHWAKPGDIVLLAPGCASFDMYSGYDERGKDFKGVVRGYLR